MEQTFEFLKLVLDSLTEHIVVIDQHGEIQLTNRSWVEFGVNNECAVINGWVGVNYLSVCSKSAEMGDELASKAYEGIKGVINGLDTFYLEYPCHSPNEKRWFMMRVKTFFYGDTPYYSISHQNITDRKLAEEQASRLSRQDGLTSLANRRFFDEFFSEEWLRCSRLNLPITVAMVDIDHFKLLNDTYGHQYGDECLIKISETLNKFANRPGDLCARYGGEEFILVFGNSTAEQLSIKMDELLDEIRRLAIPNKKSPINQQVTVSVGIATMYPDKSTTKSELLQAADSLLYSAKSTGRNRVAYSVKNSVLAS